MNNTHVEITIKNPDRWYLKYTNRAKHYVQLHNSFWGDSEFMQLANDEKAMETHLIDIVVDTETNGLNPYCSCVIEAYFYIDRSNNYLLKAKPDFWDEQAAEIHGISYAEAMTYPDKKTAWRDFLKWLPKDFRFLNWSNKNTELGCVNFDYAIIWNELNLLGMPQYHLENHYKMKQPYSVYDLAKECAKNRLFTPIRNMRTNREQFSQEAVYRALFNDSYNSHNAKDDVLALVKIYNKLLQLNNESNSDLFWFKTSYS